MCRCGRRYIGDVHARLIVQRDTDVRQCYRSALIEFLVKPAANSGDSVNASAVGLPYGPLRTRAGANCAVPAFVSNDFDVTAGAAQVAMHIKGFVQRK